MPLERGRWPSGQLGLPGTRWVRPDAITLPAEGSVSRATIADEAYPLRVNWGGVLVDNPEHEDDVVRRVREGLALLWGELVAGKHAWSSIAQLMRAKGLVRSTGG